jgi:hypothetical protein
VIRALLSAATLLQPGWDPGPCDVEIKPITSRWEHVFQLSSGAFFGRGPTPLFTSSLQWLPSYALDKGGDRRIGLIVGATVENPDVDPQLGARYSAFFPLVSFAAGYELSPEVVVGINTGHVRLGALANLALIKTLRIGIRPQVDLPHGWPLAELTLSYAISGTPDTTQGAPIIETENLTRWDNALAFQVELRARSLFSSRPADTLTGAAKKSADLAWDLRCRDRARRLKDFLQRPMHLADVTALTAELRPSLPEFADAVSTSLSAAPPPPEAPADAAVAAVVRGLRRAALLKSP